MRAMSWNRHLVGLLFQRIQLGLMVVAILITCTNNNRAPLHPDISPVIESEMMEWGSCWWWQGHRACGREEVKKLRNQFLVSKLKLSRIMMNGKATNTNKQIKNSESVQNTKIVELTKKEWHTVNEWFRTNIRCRLKSNFEPPEKSSKIKSS